MVESHNLVTQNWSDQTISLQWCAVLRWAVNLQAHRNGNCLAYAGSNVLFEFTVQSAMGCLKSECRLRLISDAEAVGDCVKSVVLTVPASVATDGNQHVERVNESRWPVWQYCRDVYVKRTKVLRDTLPDFFNRISFCLREIIPVGIKAECRGDNRAATSRLLAPLDMVFCMAIEIEINGDRGAQQAVPQ